MSHTWGLLFITCIKIYKGKLSVTKIIKNSFKINLAAIRYKGQLFFRIPNRETKKYQRLKKFTSNGFDVLAQTRSWTFYLLSTSIPPHPCNCWCLCWRLYRLDWNCSYDLCFRSGSHWSWADLCGLFCVDLCEVIWSSGCGVEFGSILMVFQQVQADEWESTMWWF